MWPPHTTTPLAARYRSMVQSAGMFMLNLRTKFHTPSLNTLRTGDANLRFYITTAQDG